MMSHRQQEEAGGGGEKRSFHLTKFQQAETMQPHRPAFWPAGNRSEQSGSRALEGNMECPRGRKKNAVQGSGGLLGDVLLPGRSVNVSDHTLHHPLYTLVHAVPVEKQ